MAGQGFETITERFFDVLKWFMLLSALIRLYLRLKKDSQVLLALDS